MSKTEKLLREIIALPSVNPAFIPANHPHAGEQRVADFLAVTAARAGLEVEFQKVLPGRSNLIAHLRPRNKIRQTILVAPHLDTVPAASDSQFQPKKKGDRLFGRGACDTKGSVAAMLTALCELAQSKTRPIETEIIFAGLVDEENAQAGSRTFADIGLKADLAIVGEPTQLKIVTAHKGNLWLQLETQGRSAHGARPELGSNAIHAMARIVDALETDYAAELRQRRHPLLGSATVNVGVICGGTQPNIVPNRCAITLDRRTLPGETEITVKREIAVFLAKRKLRATFSNARLAPCLPLETDSRLPLVQQFLRSAGQRQPVGVHYFCDAAVLAEGGIPSVVFGPGDIAQAHTSDEWISLRSLERAKDILVNYFKSLP
ncbi:MAG: succinyl-diaminopimelate desuccinylase [Verrucomicrobiota bacterium]|jgi:acetylornithine deacetylase/succinyl-diaminopimelate desuccinylase-like protein